MDQDMTAGGSGRVGHGGRVWAVGAESVVHFNDVQDTRRTAAAQQLVGGRGGSQCPMLTRASWGAADALAAVR